MCEGTQLPGSKVGREDDDPAAALDCVEVVFEPIMQDVSTDIRLPESREMRELYQQPAKVSKTAPKDLLPFGIRQVRQRQAKIAKAGLSLSGCEFKSNPPCRLGSPAGERARHRSKELKQRPSKCVFDELFNASAHPWYFHILFGAMAGDGRRTGSVRVRTSQ
jgi:hypothetical protein